MSSKKSQQLGMNAGTAANRLRVDLLFKLAVDAGYKCHRCGEPLTRDSFSIEHIEPWLDSDDPVGLFFDLGNVAFSHSACNYSASRKTNQKYWTNEDRLAGEREIDERRRETGRRTETKRIWRQKRRELGLSYT